MKYKFFGIIATLVLTVFVTACNETANENTNVNRNANVNANTSTPTPVASANANSNRAPTRAEYEKNKQSTASEAKSLGRKIGTGLDDGWLWTKARFDLAAADDLRDSTINVDVDNAVVTLTGTVATAAQKTKAESVAKAVEGVKSVKNLLKVSANNNTNTNANVNANANANARKKKS
jgi:hypothetical protein